MSVSNCERLYDSWVCGLAEKLLDIDSFLCYDKVQLPQWLRLEFVGSQWSLWFILENVIELLP